MSSEDQGAAKAVQCPVAVRSLLTEVESLILEAQAATRPLELQPFRGRLFEQFVAADRSGLIPDEAAAAPFDDADEDQLAVSPVVLSAELGATPHQDVLLNLGAQVPAAFERFSRLIEVVSSTDEQDRGQARLRWKHYAARGYAIVRHDLVLKGG